MRINLSRDAEPDITGNSRLRRAKANAAKSNTRSVYAGLTSIGNNQDSKNDRISQIKKQAKEQAMKVMSDAYSGEKELDEIEKGFSDKAEELRGKNSDLQKQIKDLDKQKQELIDSGSSEDSEEVQALEAAKEPYTKQIESNKKEITAQFDSIRAMDMERCKSQPMVKAKDVADGINEAASKAVIGVVMGDVKENIDEKAAEMKEAIDKKNEEADEKAEKEAKKKAEEAKLEAIKEAAKSGDTTVTQTSDTSETANTTDNADINAIAADPQKEIQKILNELKLTTEDIKGATVDELL